MIWLRYALVFIGMAVGGALLVHLVNANTDTQIGSAAQLMVPGMIAAVIEGKYYYRSHGERPGANESLRLAAMFTVLATALNVALAYLPGALMVQFGKLAVAPFLGQQFVILLGIYALGYLVFNWFFFRLGAQNAERLAREDRP
ncbi:MAG: ABZJ_00895 family protein [Roseovarius sp.]